MRDMFSPALLADLRHAAGLPPHCNGILLACSDRRMNPLVGKLYERFSGIYLVRTPGATCAHVQDQLLCPTAAAIEMLARLLPLFIRVGHEDCACVKASHTISDTGPAFAEQGPLERWVRAFGHPHEGYREHSMRQAFNVLSHPQMQTRIAEGKLEFYDYFVTQEGKVEKLDLSLRAYVPLIG
jgi:hypothetical protein